MDISIMEGAVVEDPEGSSGPMEEEPVQEHWHDKCLVDDALVPELRNQEFHGTVESLTDNSGMIAFQINNQVQKAKFFGGSVVVDNIKLQHLTSRLSLLTVLDVGMSVSLRVEHFKGSKDCNFKATLVEVEGFKGHTINESVVVDQSTSLHEITDVHNKVFHGTIENLTNSVGTVAFQINNREEKAVFRRRCVYVNNLKLKKITKCTAFLTVLEVGMPVSVMVVHYKGVNGCNFMATVVEVERLQGQIGGHSTVVDHPSPQASLIVHNKVFYGTIESLGEGRGKVAFQINNKNEMAFFYRNSLLVNKLKLTAHTSLSTLLDVGMHVSVMVDYHKTDDCNFVARVVEVLQEHIINDDKVVCSIYSQESVDVRGKMYYGIIECVCNTFGIVAFQINNMEEKAVFYKSKVLINNVKPEIGTSLLTMLKVGMHVSLMVDHHRTDGCNFLARVVEVLQGHISNEDQVVDNTHSQKCLDDSDEVFSGTIERLSEVSGIIAFHFNNKEERAIFLKHSVFIDEERVLAFTSLLSVVQIGMPVSLIVDRCTGYKNFNFVARLVEVSQQYITSRIPVVDELNGRVFHGTIQSLNHTSGMIAFELNNEQEKAIMFRNSVLINNEKLTKCMSLLTVLEIGMPVSLKVDHYIGFNSCNFKATGIEVQVLKGHITAVVGNLAPQENSDVHDEVFSGTISNLTEICGTVKFQVNNENQMALFFSNSVHINKIKLTKHVSLLTVLRVGMSASLKVTHYSENEDHNFLATSVEVEIMKERTPPRESCDFSGEVFHGTIESLSEIAGIIAFQIKNKDQKAIFFKNSIYIGDVKVESNVSLSTVLKVGMSVLFNMECHEGNSSSNFKATLVKVNDLQEHVSSHSPVTGCTSSDKILDVQKRVFYGTIQSLTEISGVAEFQISNKNEKALFFKDSVCVNKVKIKSGISLLTVLQVGMSVSLMVDHYTENGDCNFRATAVEVEVLEQYTTFESPIVGHRSLQENLDVSNNIFHGTIESLTDNSGVIAFKISRRKNNTAIFFKSSVRVGKLKVERRVSLLTVLQVGMPVTLQLECHKGAFEATRVEINGHNSTETFCAPNRLKVSRTKHISFGCGTVAKIVSPTTACLRFEFEGQQVALFELSDLFLNGQRSDPTRAISEYISNGDTCFFNATKMKGRCEYISTCVWKGKKPSKVSIFDSYQALAQEADWLPSDSFLVGTVSQLAPPSAAIVTVTNCSPVLLFISALKLEEDGPSLAQDDWIQDHLCVGDIVRLKLTTKDIIRYNFRVVGSAWKLMDRSKMIKNVPEQTSSDETSPSYTNGSQSLRPRNIPPDIQEQYGSKPRSTLCTTGLSQRKVINHPAIENVVSLSSEVSNMHQYVTCPTSLLGIVPPTVCGIENYGSNAEVGDCSSPQEADEINYIDSSSIKGAVVKYSEESVVCVKEESVQEHSYDKCPVDVVVPEKKNSVYCGTVLSLTSNTGTITFQIGNRNEIAVFCKNKVYVNKVKVTNRTPLLTLLHVGMPVSLMVIRYAGYKKFVATQVEVEMLEGLPIMLQKSEYTVKEGDLHTPSGTFPSSLLNSPIRGLTGKIKSHTSSLTGIVECCIHGIKMEASYTRDMVISNNEMYVSIQEVLPVGKLIYLDGMIKDFQGNPKLRIIYMWHGIKHQLSKKQLREINPTLKNGEEYTGTVCEIRLSRTFIVSVGNVPVFVASRYFSEPLKMQSLTCSIALGDTVRMVVQRKYGKKMEFDWVAIDAWRENDEGISSPARLQDDVTCSVASGLVAGGISDPGKLQDEVKCNLEGRLMVVEESGGVLEDNSHGGTVSFQHQDAFLLGVPLANMDLTQVLTSGDTFSYSLPTQSQATQVWFGTQEYEDCTHQFGEIITYCKTRSLDTAVYNTLTSRLGNIQVANKGDTTQLGISDSDTDDPLSHDFVFRGFRSQAWSRNSESREPHVLWKKPTEPNLVTENSTAPSEQLLAALSSDTKVRAKGDSTPQNELFINEMVQVSSLNESREKLSLSTYPILDEGLKESLWGSLLSILHQQYNDKTYSEQMAADVVESIEDGVKKVTGRLLQEALWSIQVPEALNGVDAGNIQSHGKIQGIEMSTESPLKQVSADEKPSLEERVGSFRRRMELCLEGKDNGKMDGDRVSLVEIFEDFLETKTSVTEEAIPKQVLCVDRGTQTTSTGKIIFLNVAPDDNS